MQLQDIAQPKKKKIEGFLIVLNILFYFITQYFQEKQSNPNLVRISLFN
jgi:hypothetical protein